MLRPSEGVASQPVLDSGEDSGENAPKPAKRFRRPPLDKTFQQAIFDVYEKACKSGSYHPVTHVCESLKVHRSLVSKVLRQERPISPRKSGPKEQFKWIDHFDKDVIRRTIYENYKKNCETSVQSVYEEVREKLPNFPYSRTVFYRLLKSMNFCFEKVTKKNAAKFTDRIKDWKNYYVTKIKECRCDNKVLVWLHETWYDTESATGGCADGTNNCNVKVPKNKGKRIIILHAASQDGFVPGCLLTSAKDIHNSAKDYHQDLFETWVRTQLLPSLERLYSGRQCVIITDNASCHSGLRIPKATKSKTKEELAEIMALHDISVPDKLPSKEVMIALIKERKTAEQHVVDNLIRAAGHEILRLPPYNCDLNPIELVWSQVKLNIRRRNQHPELSEFVVALVIEEMNNIPNSLWESCCQQALALETIDEREHLAPVSEVIICFNDDVDDDNLDGIDPLKDV